MDRKTSGAKTQVESTVLKLLVKKKIIYYQIYFDVIGGWMDGYNSTYILLRMQYMFPTCKLNLKMRQNMI